MIDKITNVLNRNLPKETRSEIWEWCFSHVSQVPITKENLENMSKTELVWGIYGGYSGNQGSELLNSIAVAKLAQGLGILGLQNPEGGANPCPLVNVEKQNDSQLLARIEKVIGFKINLPPFVGGNELSKTDYGVISDRHCAYLWVLKKILDLLPNKTSSNTQVKVIEIGAGMGFLGYFLDKAGCFDYTIIDLAYTNALQTYFLHKNLPNRELILSGDVQNPFDNKYRSAIKILHASDFVNVPTGRFDIMINVDSLTEIPLPEAHVYANSDCAKYLLSINHEMNNHRVVEICKPTRLLKYRYPFWIRDGYVEELYQSVFL
jgi:hypothetical protein